MVFIKSISASLMLLSLLSVTGCASPSEPYQADTPTRRYFTDEATKEQAEKQFNAYDPAEPVNKYVYAFNAGLDEYILIPVVDAYKFVTPEFLRHGIRNFFLNVGEVTNFTNAVFQAKPHEAAQTLGRFAINSTMGLLGAFDVATDWGIARQPEDFGKTLGYWGVDPGAYVVLPVLGPSNMRDMLGTAVDYATLYFIIPDSVKDTTAYDVVAYGVEPVNTRYGNDFRYYRTGSPFEYELVRYVATQARGLEIEKARKE